MAKPYKVHAKFEVKSAPLSSEFGLEWATKLFGADTIAALPVFVRGKNVGKPKGHVMWEKCSAPGWSSEFYRAFAVGGIARAWIGANYWPTPENAVRCDWMGRVQDLCLPSTYLFQEGRERKMREDAHYAADLKARYAEEDADRAALASDTNS